MEEQVSPQEILDAYLEVESVKGSVMTEPMKASFRAAYETLLRKPITGPFENAPKVTPEQIMDYDARKAAEQAAKDKAAKERLYGKTQRDAYKRKVAA